MGQLSLSYPVRGNYLPYANFTQHSGDRMRGVSDCNPFHCSAKLKRQIAK